MSNNDIRKFLNLIESNNLDSDKSFLEECMNDSTKQWYMDATNSMVSRIRSGEYPIDVVNELAREYSWTQGGSYESFAFARDALDRRAWEMGLRYADETEVRNSSDTQSYHDSIITPQVTESEDDAVFEEMINEAGLLSRIIDRMAPGYTAKLESNNEFKSLARKSYALFQKKYGFGDGRNLTFANAKKLLIQQKVHPAFVEKVSKEFSKKFPNAIMGDFDKRAAQSFFIAVAAETMIEGGIYATLVDEYTPEETPTKSNNKTKEKSNNTDTTDNNQSSTDTTDTTDTTDNIGPNKKLLAIRTIDDALQIATKAMNGDVSFSPEELHDMGVLLQRFAIPGIKAKTRS